jgi:hypothetical protein
MLLSGNDTAVEPSRDILERVEKPVALEEVISVRVGKFE